MFKLKPLNSDCEPIWIRESRYLLGTASDAHIRLMGADIAPHHALLLREGESYLLKDNGSPAGTFINGHRITIRPLNIGDTIKIGGQYFLVLPPHVLNDKTNGQHWQLLVESGWSQAHYYRINVEGPTVLGRAEDCDIRINHPHIARRQLQFTPDKQGFIVTNLSPRLPLLLNDQQITQSIIAEGDSLLLDVIRFRVMAPSALTSAMYEPVMEVSFAPAESTLPENTRSITQIRWKTKPTSPGNRYDYPMDPPRRPLIYIGVIGIIIIALLGGILLW